MNRKRNSKADREKRMAKMKIRNFHSLTPVTGLLLCLAAALDGCVLPSSGPREIKFSPNSSKVAYIWLDEWNEPWLDGRTLSRTISIKWCGVDTPDVLKSVRVGSVGMEWAGYISVPTPFEFSPDSRHLAIIVPWKLSVINLYSGKLRGFSRPDEIVSSFVWLSNNEIGYVAHANLHGKHEGITDRTFWRQKISDSPDARVAIHREMSVKPGVDFLVNSYPLEIWSPRGRYVVFKSRYHGGPFKFLDVATGTVRAFGQLNCYPEGIAWKPDGSAVMCISEKMGQQKLEFLLVDSATGRVEDFTKQFVTQFGNDIGIGDVSWAYEGGYLFFWYLVREGPEWKGLEAPPGFNYHHRYLLISLHPWQVLDIGEKVTQRFGPESVFFKRHLLGGCICAVGKDKNGIGRIYAADCTGSHFWQLNGTPSPDGKLMATIDRHKKLKISKTTPPKAFLTKHWTAEPQAAVRRPKGRTQR